MMTAWAHTHTLEHTNNRRHHFKNEELVRMRKTETETEIKGRGRKYLRGREWSPTLIL